MLHRRKRNASEFFFFFDTWSLSLSFLRYKAFWLVINFLVLSSSPVHFKKDPEYITRKPAQVFIPLMRFLLQFCYYFTPCEFFTLVLAGGLSLESE